MDSKKVLINKLYNYMKISDREVYYRMFNSQVLKESYNYSEIESDIKKMVKEYFEVNSEIYCLGSRVIGLGYDKEESDLDIFIDIGHRYFESREFVADFEIIDYLKEIFSELENEWTFKKINYSVPSIKAVHQRSGVRCDISVTNGLAVHNSHLLRHLFDIQPEAVAFFHYIKKWLQLFDVKFKGFTLTLLVVFYLQQINLMPAIINVQQDVEPKVFIDDCAVQFDNMRDRAHYGIEELRYFKDHVKGFFNFYEKFNYQQNVICTYSGISIDKHDFLEKIELNSPMVVSAPLLRRTNCAKYVTNLLLSKFIQACSISTKYLKNKKFSNHVYLEHNTSQIF